MKKYFIVGAFPLKNKSTIIGGQITACRNLFPKNLYSEEETLRFDTTQLSNPPPILFLRLILSLKRFPFYVKSLLIHKPKSVIIFISSGTSFLEKTIYIFIANLLNFDTVSIPRSDLIIKQIKSKMIYKFFYKILEFSTKRFIFQSNTFLIAFPQLHKKKFLILPNCIKPSKKVYPKKLSKVKSINLLFVGWLEPIKNISLLLESSKYFEKLFPKYSVKIHIVGSGSQMNYLKIKAKELGLNAIFYGWIKNPNTLNKIYEISDCFCLTSLNEGFPNVVLEAMSYGLPILSTKVGALSYWLDEGRNILFSSNNNPKSYAKNIKKLFSSEELFYNISKNNLGDIKTKFSCKKIAKDLKNFLC